MRFRRFEIAGDSMLPTLTPGDYVLGDRDAVIRPSHLVALEHPTRPAFWLVKRVLATHGLIDLDAATIDGHRYDDAFRDASTETGRFEVEPGTMFVLSDNRATTRADSRTWGPIPQDGAYVLMLRYWPARSVSRI